MNDNENPIRYYNYYEDINDIDIAEELKSKSI